MGSSQSSHAADPHQSSSKASAGIKRVGGRKSNNTSSKAAASVATNKVPGGGKAASSTTKSLLGLGGAAGKKDQQASVVVKDGAAGAGGAIVDVVPDKKTNAATTLPGLVGSFVSETTAAGPSTAFFVVDSRDLSEEVVDLDSEEIVVSTTMKEAEPQHHLEGVVEEEESEDEEELEGAVLVPSDVSSTDEDDIDDEEDEEDEVWEERLRILEEAKSLKAVATWFLRPELKIVSLLACASNYFDRASMQEPVPTSDSEDEEDEVKGDVMALKASARAYLHPEDSVVASPSACARSYFTRASAPEFESDEAKVERDLVWEDLQALKASAVQFLHPELPLQSSPSACARNYYTRASAPEYEDDEADLERDYATEDVKALKAAVTQYLHPELPVAVSPLACARNYFTRPSAPEYDVEAEERNRALQDAKSLKASAAQYMHPELAVKSSPSVCARNYFTRPSAPEYEDDEVDLERDYLMEDVMALKAAAAQYLHPELPITSSPSACARSYFTRASAPEYEQEDQERDYALQDAKMLEAAAVQYLHPEIPVTASPSACARNYFSRASAPEYEEDEEDLERDYAMEDVMALKAAAVQYLHPELPVTSSPSMCARNYFSRASAPEYEEGEVDLERDYVMEDVKSLKAAASRFLHPELPVASSPSACARSYFTRVSAPEYEEDEVDLERDYAMEDAMALKAAAAQYLHPELPVKSSPSACARNYFTRSSAPEYEEDEEDLERDYAMQDAKALKASAVQYLHPEAAVSSSIAVTRASPFVSGGAMDERATILEEMKQLKSLAKQYLHPEKPVIVSPEATARCYFSRPTADAYESPDDVVARAEVLNDVKSLKARVVQYRTPEAPVVVDPEVTGRNYFDRASAATVEDDSDDSDERKQVLADAAALKKHAVDFLHPELGMAGRSTAGGRSYFDRPSARGHDHMVHTFPAHEDDLHHDDHHHDEHMDHFGMDEEMEARFDDLRNHLPMGLKSKAAISGMAQGSAGSDEEGKLSRSPSSVMLFTEESIYD